MIKYPFSVSLILKRQPESTLAIQSSQKALRSVINSRLCTYCFNLSNLSANGRQYELFLKLNEYMKRIVLLVCSIFCIADAFGLNGNGSSANPYNGNITQPTVFGPGTVYINGNISNDAYVLTIQPGTTLRIYDNINISFTNNGKLNAVGTKEAPVIFTADNNNWGHAYFYNSNGSVLNYCIFEKGMIPLSDGNGHGGALYSVSSMLQISNCIFRNNVAFHGGAIELDNSPSEITDCIFEGNTAYRGSALFFVGNTNTPVINRCKIYSNHATDRSSVHGLTDAAVTIQNTLIYNNTNANSGGGGGVNFGGTTEGSILVNIINCVLANNNRYDVFFRGSARFSVRNSIVWGSVKSVYYDFGETPRDFNLINCAVQGVYNFNTEFTISFFQNSLKLNSNNSATDGPNFIYPLSNYNITSLSPCRDQGTDLGTPAPPVLDIVGNGRVGQYDIGAYEIQGQYIKWTGAVSNEWNNSDNWTPGIIPAAMNDVGIFSAVYEPIISSSEIVTCNNLIIEPSANMTVGSGGALTVHGSLVINSSGTNHSGSFINNGLVTGSVSYNRGMNASNYHYFSSPVVSGTVPTLATVWAYNEPAGTWDINTACKSGVGYTIDTGIDLLSFSGSLAPETPVVVNATSPYKDIITTSLENYTNREYVGVGDNGHSGMARSLTDNYGGGGWNLLGNPYTSAINVSGFIDANATQFDPNYVAVYLYDGSTYYYIGNSTGWGIVRPDNEKHIQVGQGFFVLAMNDFSSFTFSRSMQEHDTEVTLLKSTIADNRWPGLQLKVKSGKSENMTTVVYNEGMTSGLDPGYDVGLMSSGSDVEVYTTLVKDNGVNFTRQALPIVDCDKNSIAVGIDSEEGGKITFSAVTVPIEGYKYYLEDRSTGTLTDLTTSTYTVSIPAKCSGTGRFYIKASATLTGISGQPADNASEDIRIWATNGKIIIKGEVGENATCTVYNMKGCIASVSQLEDAEFNEVRVPDSEGIYIVKVLSSGKAITKKVVMI